MLEKLIKSFLNYVIKNSRLGNRKKNTFKNIICFIPYFPIRFQQDEDDDIAHLEWETVRVRFVKAATIGRLVEALSTTDRELDSATFASVFFATYRTFATTEQVISLLIERYEQLVLKTLVPDASSEKHKKSLLSALHDWIKSYPEDWNYHNLSTIFVFISQRLYSSDLYNLVLSRLDEKKRVKSAESVQLHDHYSYESMKPFVNYSPSVDAPMKFTSIMGLPSRRTNCSEAQFSHEMELLKANSTLWHYSVDYNGYGTSSMYTYRFPNVCSTHFAEQLTRIDAVSTARIQLSNK